MTENTEQLTETFAAHEHLAPDAADVLAKAHGIARSYQRRKWAVRATGGAVLGAGLVAGGLAIPGSGHAAPRNSAVKQLAPAADPTPSPSDASTTTSTHSQQAELDAFFAAGYDYNDAETLAQMWGTGKDIVSIKAEAGEKLLDGHKLPIPPSGQPESIATQDENAFLDGGYGYDDAVRLGKMWNESVSQAKIDAGAKLLAGETLPFAPSDDKTSGTGGSSSDNTADDQARAEYFADGYTYDDAVKLSHLWNNEDPWQVKADAGKKLLAGKTLPVQPSGTPTSDSPQDVTYSQKDIDAFFNAGYGSADAVRLGNLWNVSNLTQVKADAGKKLLAGQTLPIAP
jgi:hypothetical protein